MVEETTETLLRRIAELEQLLRGKGGVARLNPFASSSRPRGGPRSRSPRSCSPLVLPMSSPRARWYEMTDSGEVELAEEEVAGCMVDEDGDSSDEETVTTPAYNLVADLELDDEEILSRKSRTM